MPDHLEPPALSFPRRLRGSREFAFLVVGGLNTVVGLAAFALLFAAFGTTLHYLGALILAYCVGILVGFILHRHFVFQVHGGALVDLVRFSAVQGTAFGLNAVLLAFFVEVLGLPVLPAQVCAQALVVVGSYFGHLLFSFRRPVNQGSGSP